MKKSLLAMSLFLTTTAFANDWTPYLQGMKNTCDLSALNKLVDNYRKTNKLPKTIAGSVAHFEDWGISSGFEISLKNATAFGLPIQRIEQSISHNGFYDVNVVFKDTKFMSLLPQFYVTKGDGKKEYAGSQKLWAERHKYPKEGESKTRFVKSYALPYYSGEFDSSWGNWYAKPKSGDVVYKAEQAVRKQDKVAKDEFVRVYRTEKTGWQFNYLGLSFDKSEKRIQCYGSG